MANQEHLDILKQGVEVWNRWRQEQVDILPDLSGADLQGANLRGVNFTEVETALEKERQLQEQGNPQIVLFPVRTDDTVLYTNKPWAKEVRRCHIIDFTQWKKHDTYWRAFDHLLRDLKAESRS